MTEPTGVVALVAEIRCLPGATETVAGLLDRLTVDVRTEPGNLVFDAWRRADDSNEFVIYEQYRDETDFESHLRSGHTQRFNAALTHLAADGRSRISRLAPLAADGGGA